LILNTFYNLKKGYYVKIIYKLIGKTMDLNTENIIECKSCGLFVNKQEASKKYLIKCPRCNTKLRAYIDHSYDSLFYAISAIMLFILMNIYPLIKLSINNKDLQATLYDTVFILLEQNLFFVALIVFFTIIIAPLFNSIIIIVAFIQKHTKVKFFTKTFLHDSFHFTKTWGFIEVFIISIIVTYIKLVGMVSSTRFDLGFYIMLFYIFCFYMSNKKFEGKSVFGE
jgi:paraquat-inducible protein A